jgi:outer membrane autotransporter protein
MKRLDTKLKLSVSLLALMSGGAVLASNAQAVVVSGAQNSVVVTTDISDLTVDSTGDVSPGGVLVQGNVAGAVVNDGSIEFIDTPIASESDDVTALAVGFEALGTIGGDMTNNGTVTATADAGVSVIADFTDKNAISEDAPSSADATAIGVSLNEIKGDIVNKGDIAATATADASSDLSVKSDKAGAITGGADSYAEAIGIEATLVGSDFTNAKDATITADASATSDVVVDVTGTSGTLFAEDSIVEARAYATGADLEDAGTITNAGSIAATADASATLDGLVSATGGAGGMGGGEDASLQVDSYASGVWSDGELKTFSNTGSITAAAKSAGTLKADVDAVGGAASAFADNWVYAGAEGVDLDSADSFSNAGTIKADASATLAVDAFATGKDGAGFGAENDVESESWGVYIDTLDGPFTNSGAITSTATSDLKVVADADSGTTLDGTIETGGMVSATAWGVEIDDLDGSFTNAKDGKIVADASATSSYDVGATGVGAGGAAVENATLATAIGVSLSGGEDTVENPDTNSVSNAGTISAVADAISTVTLTGTSDDKDSTGAVAHEGWTGAVALGLLDTGDATGFDNSGTISAAATASQTVTANGAGLADSSASSDNLLYAAAVGAAFTEPLDGNVVNSGNITANASGTLDIDLASGSKEDPGSNATQNLAGVAAVGFYADIEAPMDDKDPASSFSNTGTISATGNLKIDVTQPAASKDFAPEQDTVGGVLAMGAVVSGDPSKVDNAGTISASATLNSTGVAGEDSGTGAAAVGLWLPEADDGLVVNNSGKITAEVGGNADASAAVGLMLGPLPEGLLEGVIGAIDGELPLDMLPLVGGIGGEDLEAMAEGVITVNNTGTISGIDKTEGGLGYGIFAETAPVSVVINQQGGLITGSTAAIAMDQGNADTLNWSGGSISGLVDADEMDVVNVIQAKKDGKGVDTTVTAGKDFTLEGAGELNIGTKGAPVTFVMNGNVTNVGETNLNTDGKLVVGPTGKIDTGTYNQADGSTLVIQFNPTSAGLITTEGDANIDGNFQAQALAGLYADKGSYTVIDAGGVINGKFDSIDTKGDTLLIDFSTKVNPTDVVVSWERNAFDEVDGLSDNAKSVGGAIEAGYDPNRTPSKNAIELNDQLGGLFTLTDPELYDRVLNSWSGSEHAQVMRSATNLSEPYLMALSEHLNDNRMGIKEQQRVVMVPNGSGQLAPASSVGQSAAEEAGFAIWARGFGRWADTRGDANADGFDEDTYGAVLGADFRLSPSILLGIAGSYIENDIDFDDGDTGKITRWSIGGYASAQFDAFYLDGSFTYASDDYKVNRTIITGGMANPLYNGSAPVTSEYDGDGWIAHAEAGFNWMLGDTAKLQPFAGINYTSIDTDPFSETGGGDLGLDVLDGTGKSLQSRLGARLTGQWGSGDVLWVPELRGEWRHEFKDNPAWIQASLAALPDEPFTTVGSRVSRDMAVVGAGISAQFRGGWGLYVDYQGAFASGYTSHVAQGGVRVKF